MVPDYFEENEHKYGDVIRAVVDTPGLLFKRKGSDLEYELTSINYGLGGVLAKRGADVITVDMSQIELLGPKAPVDDKANWDLVDEAEDILSSWGEPEREKPDVIPGLHGDGSRWDEID